MTPAAWIAICGLVFTGIVQAVGLVIWGARLTQRVKTLEEEMEPLKGLLVQVARMAERQDMWIEQLKELNASIRWMRNPAEYRPPEHER
jgi:hypothetical protein